MTLPEPYYQTELGTLYCGDCLEIMPHLPKVDLEDTFVFRSSTKFGGSSGCAAKLLGAEERAPPILWPSKRRFRPPDGSAISLSLTEFDLQKLHKFTLISFNASIFLQ